MCGKLCLDRQKLNLSDDLNEMAIVMSLKVLFSIIALGLCYGSANIMTASRLVFISNPVSCENI